MGLVEWFVRLPNRNGVHRTGWAGCYGLHDYLSPGPCNQRYPELSNVPDDKGVTIELRYG